MERHQLGFCGAIGEIVRRRRVSRRSRHSLRRPNLGEPQWWQSDRQPSGKLRPRSDRDCLVAAPDGLDSRSWHFRSRDLHPAREHLQAVCLPLVPAHSSALRKRCLTLQSITSTALTKLKDTLQFKAQGGTLAPKVFGASFHFHCGRACYSVLAPVAQTSTILILNIVSICHWIVP